MASASTHASFLPPVLTFLGAAVVGVPIVRLLGQSAVLGYLLAGVVIGPFGLSLIAEPETASSVAEIGVVLLLFIVGLELEISRLVSMRRDIFGLGTAQLLTCAVVLAGAGLALGLAPAAAVVIGTALALSATAVALQLLEERGDLTASYGSRAFAVLLLQDISVVAILAVLPLLASAGAAPEGGWIEGALRSTALAGLGVAAVIVVGRYGLNPFFRLLAAAGGREVMTAAALLVVLGTALLMEEVGLSMAMGAFLAGVMLAESNFRHQLEADIEPFRGMLLGLFFMSVGMSIDGGLLTTHAPSLLGATAAAIVIKVALVAGLFRLFGSPWLDAVRGGAVLAPAGEFAFVILPAAGDMHLLDATATRFSVALAALTMLVGPLLAKALDAVLARRPEVAATAPDAIEPTDARVLVVGFGRFGHLLTQVLLAEGIGITVIDKDVEQIRNAARFGFRIFYGDGTRLDVLRAAGIGRAELLCVCIDDAQAALKIVDIVHEEFGNVRTYVRAYDRTHAVELMNRDVDFQVRETLESALGFAQAALEGLGVPGPAAAARVADVRKRDVARLVLQQAGALPDGTGWLRGGGQVGSLPELRPEPLTEPQRPSRALSAETRGLIDSERREAARDTLEASRTLEPEDALPDA